MSRFDRYILSQLMVFFGFFSIILVALYWINRAVRLFDWLIASGQTAGVFLEFTVLSLPNVIRIVLPIAAFAAAVFTTNRLSSESELVVVQATGYGPLRLARPVMVFGVIVGLLVAFLAHFAVPLSHSRLADREVEVTEDVTARILTQGRFVHPEPGITLYIREITGRGELRDVFLHDAKDRLRPTTYTATEARLVRTASGPRLVMIDGIAQTMTLPERRIAVTRFQEFGTDMTEFLAGNRGEGAPRHIRELSTPTLLAADPEVAREVGATVAEMLSDGHQRFSKPLLAMIAPVLGFATLLVGGFSRFGVRKQIFASVGIVVFLSTLDSVMEDFAGESTTAWPFVYVSPLVGGVFAILLFWLAAHPHSLRPGRRRGEAPA